MRPRKASKLFKTKKITIDRNYGTYVYFNSYSRLDVEFANLFRLYKKREDDGEFLKNTHHINDEKWSNTNIYEYKNRHFKIIEKAGNYHILRLLNPEKTKAMKEMKKSELSQLIKEELKTILKENDINIWIDNQEPDILSEIHDDCLDIIEQEAKIWQKNLYSKLLITAKKYYPKNPASLVKVIIEEENAGGFMDVNLTDFLLGKTNLLNT